MIQQLTFGCISKGNKTIILKETAVVPLSLQRHFCNSRNIETILSVRQLTNGKRKCDTYIKTSSPHNGILVTF